MTRLYRFPLACAAALMLAGCGHDTRPASYGPSYAQETTRDRKGSTMAQPAMPGGDALLLDGTPDALAESPAYGPQSPMTPAFGEQSTVASYDDAQLAGIVEALHEADIERLRMALVRASSPEVKRFAEESLQAHRNCEAQDRTTESQIRIVAAPTSVSDQLLVDWKRDRSAVQLAPVLDFDATFVDHQIQLETKALPLIDSVLANVKNPALKAQLTTDRASFAETLRNAQRVRQSLHPHAF